MANEKSGNMAKGVRRMTRMYQAATKFSSGFESDVSLEKQRYIKFRTFNRAGSERVREVREQPDGEEKHSYYAQSEDSGIGPEAISAVDSDDTKVFTKRRKHTLTVRNQWALVKYGPYNMVIVTVYIK